MARARSLLPQTIRKTIVAATVRNVRAFVFSVHTARVAQAATKAVSVRKVSEPDCCKTIIIQAISPVSRVVIVRASTAVTALRVAISRVSRAVIVLATTVVTTLRVAISRVRAVISSVAHVLSAVVTTRTISREAIVSVLPITIRMLSTA
mgnify:CR=1 FL=1